MSLTTHATADATEMQPGASVDWAEMRALYCKGISLSDLSRKFGISLGTIKARSSREKWRNTVARVNEHVIQAATDDLGISAKHWIARIDKLMHAGIGHVEQRVADGKQLRTQELTQLLDCAEKANRVARANYGLDKQDTRTHIHVGFVRHGSGQAWQGSSIDVEATPVLADANTVSDSRSLNGIQTELSSADRAQNQRD